MTYPVISSWSNNDENMGFILWSDLYRNRKFFQNILVSVPVVISCHPSGCCVHRIQSLVEIVLFYPFLVCVGPSRSCALFLGYNPKYVVLTPNKGNFSLKQMEAITENKNQCRVWGGEIRQKNTFTIQLMHLHLRL